MYQKRQTTTTKLPIKRKGTKYVARASSHLKNSVPVVIALRDMLGLARTLAEVKKIINLGLLKINGKVVKNPRESIKIFNVFEADKPYSLTILPTGRFSFQELDSKSANKRLCKVKNKKLLKNSVIQLNLHDGSNILTKSPISVQDSVYLDISGKISSHVSFEKGKSVFVMSGKYSGQTGKIESVENNMVKIKFKDKEDEVTLPKSHAAVL